MKRAPQDKKVMECLGPSKFSAAGFMGDDPRELEEVVSDDATVLERLGTDRIFLADTLQAVFDRARQELGDPVSLTDDLNAEYLACRGKIPSPFPGEGAFSKDMVRVFSNDGQTIFYINPLSMHLIRTHGFFQGKGSLFRAEPEVIMSVVRKSS